MFSFVETGTLCFHVTLCNTFIYMALFQVSFYLFFIRLFLLVVVKHVMTRRSSSGKANREASITLTKLSFYLPSQGRLDDQLCVGL